MRENTILETAGRLLQLADNGEWRELLLHILEEGREGPASGGCVSAMAVLETEIQKKCPRPETRRMVHYILCHAMEKAFGKEAECKQVPGEEGDVVYLALRHDLEVQQVEACLEQVSAGLRSELDFECRIAVCHGTWGEASLEERCREMGNLLREAALLPGSGLIHGQDVETLADISYEPEAEEVKRLLEQLRPSPSREEDLKSLIGEVLEGFSESRFSHGSVCRGFETLIRKAFLEADEDLWEQSGVRLAEKMRESLRRCRTIREFQEVYTVNLLELAAILERANLSEGMKIVSKMKNRIRTEYSQNLKLSTFASEYYMNQSYLSVLFQQETGKSFSQYLTEVRLQKAKELLETTMLPTRKIAELAGYNDRNYFAAVFSKHEGQTPMQYRKALKT